jgi:hypothetical protein
MRVVFVAYTTSRPWTGPTPPGVHIFDSATSKALGQSRPFTLDLRRIAAVRETQDWFPQLDAPTHGIVGRAPERLRAELERAATAMFRRGPGVVERLGPGWPSGPS